MESKKIAFTPFQTGQIIQIENLYDAKKECPICLKRGQREQISGRIQSDPFVGLFLCNFCKGFSASSMPTEKAVTEYYSDYYKVDCKHKVTFQKIERFAEHLLKYIPSEKLADKISILDFGGGDGSLSRSLGEKLIEMERNRKIEIVVVDFLTGTSASYCKTTQINLQRRTTLDGLTAPFDIILASGIFEHIPMLHPAILKIISLTKKNTFFYARTPFNSPFMRYMPNLDFSFPGHVHDLGASFWNRFTQTFNIEGEVLASQPSIIETDFSQSFFITLAAALFKFPAHLEKKIWKHKKDLTWNFYRGWEYFLKFL